MMNENKNINFYAKDEIEKLINEREIERLVFVDDGIDEVVARFKDLPDIIVDLNRKFGSRDLKIYNFIEPEDEPIITTFGLYLNKISSQDRQAIIERLNKLQQFEEDIKDYKLLNIEDLLEYYRSRNEER